MRIGGYRNLPRPDAALRDIFALTAEWLRERGLRAVILDVDNTLGGYTRRRPEPRVGDHLRALAQAGIAVSVVSNAAEKRVRRYAFGFPCIARSGKPDPAALLDMARRLGVEPRETAMVGDQLLTDIAAGKRAGMVTVWVEPFRDNPLFDVFFRWRWRLEKRLAYKEDTQP
ncbi:MAG: YqeG family HAD IIIA-type phosphatase [Oscillospiraceae bacterium]|nr:YqeG family HAD IIIA-type phosphatase [Oscillospiraceae bacterium]